MKNPTTTMRIISLVDDDYSDDGDYNDDAGNDEYDG